MGVHRVRGGGGGRGAGLGGNGGPGRRLAERRAGNCVAAPRARAQERREEREAVEKRGEGEEQHPGPGSFPGWHGAGPRTPGRLSAQPRVRQEMGPAPGRRFRPEAGPAVGARAGAAPSNAGVGEGGGVVSYHW